MENKLSGLPVSRKKIGIMGGTFDPIHIGHLILAENAFAQFKLDKVWIMPNGNPPHKKIGQGRANTEQRVKMAELAVSDNHHLSLSLEEIAESGYAYTYDTLERLKFQNPDTEYYFIMGADSLFTFDTWKYPERICKCCNLVVAVRDHIDLSSIEAQIDKLKKRFKCNIYQLKTKNIDISSEMIRRLLRLNHSVKYYVPDKVIKYIQDENLYH